MDSLPDTLPATPNSGVDPELLQAIADAQNKQSMQQPIKPSKWNNQETRTPLQVLQDEATSQQGGNVSLPEILPVSSKNTSSLLPDTLPATSSHELPDVLPASEAPSTMDVVKQDVLNAGGSALKMGTTVVGGVTNALVHSMFPGEHPGDVIHKFGEDTQKELSTKILQPSQMEQASFPQKAVGTVAAAVPLLLTAAVSGPVGAGLMIGQAGINTVTDLLDQGSDLLRASTAGVIAGSSAAALSMVPGYGSTIIKSIGLGGITNVTSGLAADLIIHPMFADRPDIAKNYDPWNIEKRGLEAVSGATLGVGFHQYDKIITGIDTRQQKKADEFQSRFMTDIFGPHMDTLMGAPKARYVIPEGSDAYTEIKTIMNNGTGTIGTILDLISQAHNASPWQRTLADTFRSISTNIGLDQVEVHHEPIAGEYQPVPDKIALGYRNNPETFYRTVLHEVTHAITHKAMDIFENYKNSPDQLKNAPLVDQLLYKLAKPINDNLDLARKELLTAKGVTPEEMAQLWKIRDEMPRDVTLKQKTWEFVKDNFLEIYKKLGITSDSDLTNRFYGLKDLHEFASESLTNPDFIKHLNSVKVDKDTIQLLKSNNVKDIKTLWDSTKRSLMDATGMDYSQGLHNIAFDHITNTIGQLTAAGRHQNAAPEGARLQDMREKFLEDSKNNPLTKTITRKIANLLTETGTLSDLLNRLNTMSRHGAWRDWVKNNYEHIWNNKQQFLKSVGDSNFGKLSPTEQKLAHDDRTIDQVIRDTFDTYIDEGKVLKSLTQYDDLNTSGTMFYSPVILNMMKNGATSVIMKYVNQRASEFKAMTEAMYQEAMFHFSVFHNDLTTKQQLKLTDTISFYDSVTGRKTLTDRGEQWIPDDILKQQGHTEQEINAYHGMTRGEEYLFTLLNDARVRLGQEPLEPIPGYMPHVYQGAFKVLVKFIKPSTDPNTNPSEYIVHVKGFNFRQQAESYIKKLESGKYDTANGQYRPEYDPQTKMGWRVNKSKDIGQSLMATFQDHITAYNTLKSLHPDTIQDLEKIEADNMRGFTKHQLERSDVSGYLGELGTKGSLLSGLGFVSGHDKKLLTIWQNYAKSVTEFYRNTMFMDEVLSRLTEAQPLTIDGKTRYATLFENTSDLKGHLKEFGSNFTGENLNHLPWVDDNIQKMSIKIGIDPLAYKKATRLLRNSLSLIKLRANPSNYVANVFQPIHAWSLLHLVKSSLAAEGITSPDPLISFSKAIMRRFNPDEDMSSAVAWAKDHGHLEAQLEWELHSRKLSPIMDKLNTLTGGKINPAIESMSRTSTYMIGYEFFREAFKGDVDRARTAAVSLMEMTMINYDRSSRPLMYQNFGVLGEAISPFAVFRNGYVGNTALMIKHILSQKTAVSALPLIASQITYLMSAGVIGIIGVAEIDALIRTLNRLIPESEEWGIPTVEELAIKHLPDSVTFGGLSAVTKGLPGIEHGVYLGSSMNAVGGDDLFSSALLPFVQAIAGVTGVGLKTVASTLMPNTFTPAPASDVYKAGKQLLPGILSGWWDRGFMHPDSNVAPKSSSLEGGYERTPSDWNALNYFGKRSIEENKQSTINRIIAQNEKLIKKAVADVVEVAVDTAMGIPRNTSITDLKARALQLMGDPEASDKFDKMVVDGVMERRLSVRQKEAALNTYAGERQRYQRSKLEGY